MRRLKTQASLSKIVYHQTLINRAVQILKEDTVRLSDSSIDRTILKKKYFFSVSRSKRGSYISQVNFVLDGNKLNNNYTATPTEYFYSEGDKTTTRSVGSSEAEDRLLSEKPYIGNFSKYIIEIYADTKGIRRLDLLRLKKLCADKNIPIYFFKTFKDYKAANKSKAVSLEGLGSPNFLVPTNPTQDELKDWVRYILSLQLAIKNRKKFNSDLHTSPTHKLKLLLLNFKSTKAPTIVGYFATLSDFAEFYGYSLANIGMAIDAARIVYRKIK